MEIPKALIESLKGIPGFEEDAFIHAHSRDQIPVSIRLNPFKPTNLSFELSDQVPWCENAFYLKERPSFTHDPAFQAGAYYVQEAGSMFLDYVLHSLFKTNRSIKVLDLCASPGGKSTLVNSFIDQDGLLISNEVVKSRTEALIHNLSKWGTCNSVVTNNDPIKFGQMNGFFDLMVVDAPCSGSGLFRKQENAIDEWSPENVTHCQFRQKRILSDSISSIKSGGYLFYSTCSYSIEENEQIIDWLITEYGMEMVKIDIPEQWGVINSGKGFRFYPNKVRSEGFFCCVLQKTSAENAVNIKKASLSKQTIGISKNEAKELTAFIDPAMYAFYKFENTCFLMNEEVLKFIHAFKQSVYIRKAGTKVGEFKHGLVPDQELAWFYQLNYSHRMNLSRELSLQYLKKEALQITSNELGLTLMTFNDLALGWAKILPNRINNYFPTELRILT